MEALYPLTQEVLEGLTAQVAVLNETAEVIAVNNRWRRYGSSHGAVSDFVGHNYLAACESAAAAGDRTAARVRKRLTRLLAGEVDSFGLAYACAHRIYRLRATRVARTPMRVMMAHEDITNLLEARRQLRDARAGLSDARQRHETRIREAYEELGQRLAAIALATHVIERAGHAGAAVNTIRIAVEEARMELRVLRYQARSGSGD